MNIRATYTRTLSLSLTHTHTHTHTHVCAHTYTVTGSVSLTSSSPLGCDTFCAAHANVSQLRRLLSTCSPYTTKMPTCIRKHQVAYMNQQVACMHIPLRSPVIHIHIHNMIYIYIYIYICADTRVLTLQQHPPPASSCTSRTTLPDLAACARACCSVTRLPLTTYRTRPSHTPPCSRPCACASPCIPLTTHITSSPP
jgi:hypothetical protein